MERHDRTRLTLFHAADIRPGPVQLTADQAQHVRVRRSRPGDAIRLLDGRGHTGDGVLDDVGRHDARLTIQTVRDVPPPPPLEALVPIADKERMLLAAEKCVELQVTAWRPVLWARSRSVSPRGEGERFHEKVVARMRAALEQSGGAWLPAVHPDAEPAGALAAVSTDAPRLILDASGPPLDVSQAAGSIAFAVGPEGGWEDAELALAASHGWRTASLGSTVLRFETAIIAAAACIRTSQRSPGRH